MKFSYDRLLRRARVFFFKRRMRGKVIELHALSIQQISDFYLGNHLLGEIRQLQEKVDNYSFQGRSSPTDSTLAEKQISRLEEN